MKNILVVKFDNTRQPYYYDANNKQISPNDNVIVRHEGYLNYGTVKNIKLCNKNIALPKIIRIANDYDKQKYLDNKKFEKRALDFCRSQIKKYDLKMKLIGAHLTFDKSKIIFSFIAEKRVDFRILLKDLVHEFKIKIELKHVGVRDETKNIPSIGICGRPLCCNKFLTKFDTVSIKMAKNQGLSLNSMKVSGNCGRLLCCLNYEEKTYEELGKNTPSVGSIVKTPDGNGKVIFVNVLMQTVKVAVNNEKSDDLAIKIYPLNEIEFENNKV